MQTSGQQYIGMTISSSATRTTRAVVAAFRYGGDFSKFVSYDTHAALRLVQPHGPRSHASAHPSVPLEVTLIVP